MGKGFRHRLVRRAPCGVGAAYGGAVSVVFTQSADNHIHASIIVCWERGRTSVPSDLIFVFICGRAMGKLLRGVWRAIGHKLQRIIPSHEVVGGRLSSSWMVRVGFRTDPALKGLERGLPGLTPLAESMTRFVLKRMDEEKLFGLAAIAAGELLSREVNTHQILDFPVSMNHMAKATPAPRRET